LAGAFGSVRWIGGQPRWHPLCGHVGVYYTPNRPDALRTE
jgi:hypothetical protein